MASIIQEQYWFIFIGRGTAQLFLLCVSTLDLFYFLVAHEPPLQKHSVLVKVEQGRESVEGGHDWRTGE